MITSVLGFLTIIACIICQQLISHTIANVVSSIWVLEFAVFFMIICLLVSLTLARPRFSTKASSDPQTSSANKAVDNETDTVNYNLEVLRKELEASAEV